VQDLANYKLVDAHQLFTYFVITHNRQEPDGTCRNFNELFIIYIPDFDEDQEEVVVYTYSDTKQFFTLETQSHRKRREMQLWPTKMKMWEREHRNNTNTWDKVRALRRDSNDTLSKYSNHFPTHRSEEFWEICKRWERAKAYGEELEEWWKTEGLAIYLEEQRQKREIWQRAEDSYAENLEQWWKTEGEAIYLKEQRQKRKWLEPHFREWALQARVATGTLATLPLPATAATGTSAPAPEPIAASFMPLASGAALPSVSHR
jgi:hypothetical protein